MTSFVILLSSTSRDGAGCCLRDRRFVSLQIIASCDALMFCGVSSYFWSRGSSRMRFTFIDSAERFCRCIIPILACLDFLRISGF